MQVIAFEKFHFCNICCINFYVRPRLHVRQIVLMNVIYYEYKTSTHTPFVKPCNVLNLAIQNIFYVQSYNLGSTNFNKH